MKIVLFGSTGRLGGVIDKFLNKNEILLAPTREDCNLENVEELKAFLKENQPDVILNCAAMSGLEECEANAFNAHKINVLAPEEMAWFSRRNSSKFIHFSTDYVLDGRHQGEKTEKAKCRPINFYGESKWEAEMRISEICPEATIARVSWLYGNKQRPSFAESIRDRLKNGEFVDLIADKWSRPTSCHDIAQWTQCCLSSKSNDWAGVMHWTNSGGEISWFDYGCEIARQILKMDEQEIEAKIRPSKLANQKQFIAKRPVHTAMAIERLSSLVEVANWQTALFQTLNGDLSQK